MNAVLDIPTDQISVRPSRRKNLDGWLEIDRIGNSPMKVCRVHGVRTIKPMYRVMIDGTEWLAFEDEVDLLWFGRSPAQLDLDRADDIVPEHRREPAHNGDWRGGWFLPEE